jgi:hypothetical protein
MWKWEPLLWERANRMPMDAWGEKILSAAMYSTENL